MNRELRQARLLHPLGVIKLAKRFENGHPKHLCDFLRSNPKYSRRGRGEEPLDIGHRLAREVDLARRFGDDKLPVDVKGLSSQLGNCELKGNKGGFNMR